MINETEWKNVGSFGYAEIQANGNERRLVENGLVTFSFSIIKEVEAQSGEDIPNQPILSE